MLSAKLQNQVALLCYATVSHLFASFHNPRMRGEHFTWDMFPDIAAGQCQTQAFVNVVCSKKVRPEVDAHAEMTGREIAQQLVRWMTE
jgi:hypothetical protein